MGLTVQQQEYPNTILISMSILLLIVIIKTAVSCFF